MSFVNVLSRDEKYFKVAATVAAVSDYSTKVGCVAAKGNKLICSASNRLRNPAKNVPWKEATTHAEINVLRLIGFDGARKLTLYIARLNKSGQTMPSRPCVTCMETITKENPVIVYEIVYINQFGHLVKEKL